MPQPNFNPHRYVQPKNQDDIVKINHGDSPWYHGDTTVRPPGIRELADNVANDPEMFKFAVYNAMRRMPMLREFVFHYGEFTDGEVVVQKTKTNRISKSSKEDIASTIAHEVARDPKIVSIGLDANDNLTIARLKEGDRYSEEVLAKADPRFYIAYTKIS